MVYKCLIWLVIKSSITAVERTRRIEKKIGTKQHQWSLYVTQMCNVSECNTEQNTQQQKQTKKNIPEQQSLRCVCVLWNGIARLAIATDVLYAFVHFGPFISRLWHVCCVFYVCVCGECRNTETKMGKLCCWLDAEHKTRIYYASELNNWMNIMYTIHVWKFVRFFFPRRSICTVHGIDRRFTDA